MEKNKHCKLTVYFEKSAFFSPNFCSRWFRFMRFVEDSNDYWECWEKNKSSSFNILIQYTYTTDPFPNHRSKMSSKLPPVWHCPPTPPTPTPTTTSTANLHKHAHAYCQGVWSTLTRVPWCIMNRGHWQEWHSQLNSSLTGHWSEIINLMNRTLTLFPSIKIKSKFGVTDQFVWAFFFSISPICAQ